VRYSLCMALASWPSAHSGVCKEIANSLARLETMALVENGKLRNLLLYKYSCKNGHDAYVIVDFGLVATLSSFSQA
jgi:hypothetical protein